MLIEAVGEAGLDRLESLWLILHHHHQSVAPELAPFVSDAVSWAARRELYERALRGGGGILIAREADQDVGYAVWAREPMPWPATFRAAPVVAELVTILVNPRVRGQGIGKQLLEAAFAAMTRAGLQDVIIGVVPGNAAAIQLYRRLGFSPTWLSLGRFSRPQDRPAPSSPVATEPVLPDGIHSLKSLWLTLQRGRQRRAATLGPFVGDDESWGAIEPALMRMATDGLLLRTGPPADPTGVVGVAISQEGAVLADTWVTSRDIAEVALLAVTESADSADRERIETGLLDVVDQRLSEIGVCDQMIGTIAADHGAIERYRRRGFRPYWLQLTRFKSQA